MQSLFSETSGFEDSSPKVRRLREKRRLKLLLLMYFILCGVGREWSELMQITNNKKKKKKNK